jgi:hypothetical protein
LPPDPQDGDVLGWQDDQLVWVSEPIPPLIPGWNNANQSCQIQNSSGQVIVVEDNLAYLEASAEWKAPSRANEAGGVIQESELAFQAPPMSFYIPDSFGKVITFYFKAKGTFRDSSYANCSLDVTLSSTNMVEAAVQRSESIWVTSSSPATYFWLIKSYIWNRPDDEFTVFYENKPNTGPWATAKSWMMGYEVEDAGNFAVKQQAIVADQVEKMRAQMASVQANS